MKERLHFPAMALVLCLLSGLLPSSTPGAANDRPAIEPRADEWLKRMGDYLADAKAFSVNAEVWQDITTSSGQRVQAGRTLQFQVRRPNNLHVHVTSTRRNRELFYDGSTLTLLNRAQNFYGAVNTGGSLDQAMDIAIERFGIAMPLEDFLRTDPYKDMIAKVTSARDIGPVTVIGVQCEHLAFSQDNIDWQLWIESGVRPVPRKFVITYKDEPDSPQFTAIFSNWD